MNTHGQTTQDQLNDFFTYLNDLYDNKFATELNEYDKDLYLWHIHKQLPIASWSMAGIWTIQN